MLITLGAERSAPSILARLHSAATRLGFVARLAFDGRAMGIYQLDGGEELPAAECPPDLLAAIDRALEPESSPLTCPECGGALNWSCRPGPGRGWAWCSNTTEATHRPGAAHRPTFCPWEGGAIERTADGVVLRPASPKPSGGPS